MKSYRRERGWRCRACSSKLVLKHSLPTRRRFATPTWARQLSGHCWAFGHRAIFSTHHLRALSRVGPSGPGPATSPPALRSASPRPRQHPLPQEPRHLSPTGSSSCAGAAALGAAAAAADAAAAANAAGVMEVPGAPASVSADSSHGGAGAAAARRGGRAQTGRSSGRHLHRSTFLYAGAIGARARAEVGAQLLGVPVGCPAGPAPIGVLAADPGLEAAPDPGTLTRHTPGGASGQSGPAHCALECQGGRALRRAFHARHNFCRGRTAGSRYTDESNDETVETAGGTAEISSEAAAEWPCRRGLFGL